MMRSLWAGVSGLQAHQTAMDVEGNNISNVNTTGFKYSRTNFADMLSQTSKIATAPQDPLGGKNGLQVGLGTSVSTVTHVFSQGSRQTTDVKTDVAIEGDGFFVVSPDAGKTYKYTRAGDFSFDAYGNFVNHSGLIVQGWNKDANDRIDSTMPVRSIQIDPGLTIPAKATQKVTLQANLNSGLSTKYTSPIYTLDSSSTTVANPALPNSAANQKPEDFGSLFSSTGNAFNIQDGQGVWMSFENSVLVDANAVAAGGPQTVDMQLNGASGIHITGTIGTATTTVAENTQALVDLINTSIGNVNTNSNTTSYFMGITASVDTATGHLKITNTNKAAADVGKNITLTTNAGDTTGIAGGADTTAFKYQYTSGSASPATNSTSIGATKSFHTTEDLRAFMQWQLQATSPGAQVTVTSEGKYQINNPSTGVNLLNSVTAIEGNHTISESPYFTSLLSSIGNVAAGKSQESLAVMAAVHGSSTDVYDSLGSKHTITFTFRKESVNTWSWSATVPSPADIGGTAPTQNVFQGGTVTFSTNGSLANVSPQSLNVTWNNGSTAGQQLNLAFGTPGTSDGVTSNSQESQTQFIGQDGWASGILNDRTIDQNGYIIGSFTNGQSLALAQIAVAKFSNNLGLMSDGGNLFTQSANSGEPTIGAAGSGGRGAIFSQALEMSNVDLSKALTELIVIQRGYQANSKTITTSDQMLQTLLQIKS